MRRPTGGEVRVCEVTGTVLELELAAATVEILLTTMVDSRNDLVSRNWYFWLEHD
jgi:hypothetical protein